jgi:hypothetical protein
MMGCIFKGTCPHQDAADLSGSMRFLTLFVSCSYPLIYFSFHDYEESLEELTISKGQTLILELLLGTTDEKPDVNKESENMSGLLPVFQGAVGYEAMHKVFLAKKRASDSKHCETTRHGDTWV